MDFSNLRSVNQTKEIAYGFITSHRMSEKVSAPAYDGEELKKEELSAQEVVRAGSGNTVRGQSPKDISLTFNKEESYGYIGKDKDVASLDMQKAISDMQKDRIIQQYQYFVGNKSN